ncbi:MAG: GNAT family N-acetyltransferase [Ignavibacteria bacterium]|nr:GNAT family N-acetyltransferase [Ignavibacteria bacterium]
MIIHPDTRVQIDIRVIEQPDRKTTQSMLYFQFRFMEWTPEALEHQDDRYGTIPFGYVAGYLEDEIVGVVNLHKRRIRYGKRNLMLGGLGGVCTHRKHRRKGIAVRLLIESMKVLRKNACDVAFLCTDLTKLRSLYAQVGFVPLNRTYKATGLSGRAYYSDGGMIAPVCSKSLFNRLVGDSGAFDLQGQDW